MSEFTKGKWEIKDMGGDGSLDIWVDPYKPDEKLIATVKKRYAFIKCGDEHNNVIWEKDFPEETAANARLIAAAPEMLRILSKLHDAYYSGFNLLDSDIVDDIDEVLSCIYTPKLRHAYL